MQGEGRRQRRIHVVSQPQRMALCRAHRPVRGEKLAPGAFRASIGSADTGSVVPSAAPPRFRLVLGFAPIWRGSVLTRVTSSRLTPRPARGGPDAQRGDALKGATRRRFARRDPLAYTDRDTPATTSSSTVMGAAERSSVPSAALRHIRLPRARPNGALPEFLRTSPRARRSPLPGYLFMDGVDRPATGPTSWPATGRCSASPTGS